MSIVVLTLTACMPGTRAARSLLDEGRYEEAAQRMSSRFSQALPSSKERVAIYAEAINGLIERADSQRKLEAYDKAGEAYRKALDYYPENISVVRKIRLTKQNLLHNIGRCSNALMEAGLLKYRAGQIEEAIAIWKSITLFDPGNAEARKALGTATIQLENLRKLK